MNTLDRLQRLNARVTELARGKYATEILGGLGVPARHSSGADSMAAKLRTYRTKPLAAQITAAQAGLKTQGRPFKGLRVVTRDDERFAFSPRSKTRAEATANLEKAHAKFGPGSFTVHTNPNDEVLVRETNKIYGDYRLT